MAKILKTIVEAMESNKRYKVLYGGRGSGKSYGISQVMVRMAVEEKCRILCTRQTQNSLAESSYATIKRVIEDEQLTPVFRFTKVGIDCLLTGSEILFRGLQNPVSIRSLDNIKYCYVEEAQALTQEALDALLPTIRAEGSQIYFVLNPRLKDDPVYKRFIVGGGDDVFVRKLNYYNNPFLPKELVRQAEWDKRHNYDKYLWVWEGEPLQMSDAMVFKGRFRVERFETPSDVERFYFGMDFGFSRDPTVVIRCFIRDRALFVDYEAYAIGIEIDKLPEFISRIPGYEKWIVYADSERPDTISYLRRKGLNVMPSDKWPGSVEEGVEYLRSFREIVIHERCKRTADEFNTYSYKVDKRTEEVLPQIEDENNHCIDAIRYALCKEIRQKGVNIWVVR